MFDQALGLLDHHFGNLHMARRRFVEGRGNHLALHRTLHVGHFFGAFVDQQNDQIAFRMIGRDRTRDVLQDHGFAGARLGGDQRALAHALRRHDVDDAAGLVFDRRIVQFHLQPARRVERRQIVEMDLVLDRFGVFEIDGRDLQQRKIAFAVLRPTDRTFHRVTGAKPEAADLRGRNVDVVRPREIVGFRGTQEAEAILQRLHDALAHNLHIALGELFQDREQHVLLAHGRGILDFEFLGEGQKIGGGFGFKILQLHCLQAGLHSHKKTPDG